MYIPVNRLSCNEPLLKPGLMAQIVLHSDKADRVYMPLQRAFIREVERQFARNGSDKAATLMRYMLGTHDYYKVYKHNSTMSIESFNMDATLSWGKQVPLAQSSGSYRDEAGEQDDIPDGARPGMAALVSASQRGEPG